MKKYLLPIAMAFVAGNSNASTIVLDFEGAGNNAGINDFYNGGTDSLGNSGTNHGISFSADALSLIDQDAGGGGSFANEPSASTILFFTQNTAVMNIAAGFDTGFSFFYSSATNATINVYDGLNKTGNIIGSVNVVANFTDNSCTGDPTGTFCNWDSIGVAFTGTALSIDFGGSSGSTGFDDVTFGSEVAGAVVPVPAAVWLFGSGLIGLFGVKRKQLKL